MKLSPAEAAQRYGEITNGKWNEEGEWCVYVETPKGINWISSLTGKRQDRIYCNSDLAALLVPALNNVVVRSLCDQLQTFDGCYAIRKIRGSESRLSMHAWAAAIDLNAATNQLGTDGDISPDLAACFIDAGMTWGKNFQRKDPMHFSLGF